MAKKVDGVRGRKRPGRRWMLLLPVALVAVLLCAAVAVQHDASFGGEWETVASEPLEDVEFEGEEQEMLVTGYCNCGKCCGWRKKWYLFGKPVYNYGKMKGTPKKVGVTASGAVASKGTIAADLTVHSFGTRMWIPGYGPGIIQDIGGSIKGAHIDLWFPSHKEATDWGSRRIKVKVAKPVGADGAARARNGGKPRGGA